MLVLCFAMPLPAADRNWIDLSGGSFSTATNWENSILPGANDRAIFNLGATYTVTFSNNPSNARLRVGRDTVTFNLGARNYTLTSASPISLSIGGSALQAHAGHLTLQAGTLTTNGTEIGGGSTTLPSLGNGKLTVSAGATWNDAGVVAVGMLTTGTLEIVGGGDAQSVFAVIGAGRTGTATVSGPGSTWLVTNSLDVGAASTGTLNILTGAAVTDAGDMFIGAGTGVSGTVNISGAQARLIAGPVLTVGEFGNGTLSISGGGSATSPSGSDNRIGHQSSASGILNVTSGTWVSGGPITLGYFGNATVQIDAGGGVSSGADVFIARTALSTASVSLEGSNAELRETGSGGIYVGGGTSAAGGNGMLTIGPGATVTGTPLKVWTTGNLTLDGGRLRTHEFTFAPGTFHWLTGELLFDPAFVLQVGSPFGNLLAMTNGQTLVAETITIGGTSNGTLTLQDGAILACVFPLLGDSASAAGTVVADGAGARFVSSGPIVVGNYGVGQLTLANGSRAVSYPATLPPEMTAVQGVLARQPGSSGSVVVDGPGSLWSLGVFAALGDLIVGDSGSANLEIRNGGKVNSVYSGAFLGRNPGSHGEVSVHGSGSLWSVDFYDVYVGYEGTGLLSVLQGGTLDMSVAGFPGHLFIGHLNDGEVIVDGPGSTLIGQTTVGGDANGVLTVANSGFLMTDSLIGAKFPTGTASITVDGAGSMLVCDGNFGEFIVGGAGAATARISAGGQVQCLEAIIADGTGANGTVEVTGPGSQLFAAEEIDVGRKDQGSLLVSDSAAVASPFVFVTAFGTLQGDGLIIGDVFNSGLVSPGQSPGTLSIIGDYEQQPTGRLVIDLAGSPDNPVFDHLEVSATIKLDGTLEVRLADGFVPLPGTEFQILAAQSVSGDFVTKLGMADFLYFLEADGVLLRACHNRPLGDFDCTGAVGRADYDSFFACLSGPDQPYPTPSCSLADHDADGDVDLSDVAVFHAAFAAD
ncbi:MAG: hypothetical protein HY763_09750 [Planctomycetes bacterium]|nr:hypothetical protein [Planctomycetota bacterium]